MPCGNQVLEENREESPECKLWTHCGRLRAGGLSGGRAEFSRAGGHGRRRARRRGASFRPGTRRGKQCADLGRIFEKHIRRAGAGKRCRPARPGQRRAELGLANDITASGSFLFGALNAVNQMAFQGARERRRSHRLRRPAHILLVGACGWGASVGERRFFLESRVYRGTRFHCVFLPLPRAPHKAHGTCGAGAGCKAVPVGAHDCGPAGKSCIPTPWCPISLPKTRCALRGRFGFQPMMKGRKWRCFLFSRFFYLLVCAECVHTGPAGYSVHLALLQSCICGGIYGAARRGEGPCFQGAQWLCDTLLEAAPCEGEYPAGQYILPEAEGRRWLQVDYHCNYFLQTLVLLFFTFFVPGLGVGGEPACVRQRRGL